MPRTIFENIVIQHYDEVSSFEYCPYTAIRFFEVLIIERGSGSLIINGNSIPYCCNQLFVFVPSDKYTFEISTPTSVSTIKFLNSMFIKSAESADASELKEWFRKIEIVLHSTNRSANIKLRSETEESSVLSLFKVICKEFNDEELKSDVIIKNMLHSILHIISRNVGYESIKTSSSKIQEMLNYIHYHIYDSELISNRALAGHFNISGNYIGQYFKKEMGISLKKYILNYKVKLAETRLNHTDATLSEIALELGFTDSSHLDKTFLAYKGLTAGNFRQTQRSF